MKVLVVALDATEPPILTADSVLVIARVNSRLRRWLSDEDGARRRAEKRLEVYVERLQRAGRHVSGRVGDADPVLAIADALAILAADEILVAADTESSRRLAREVAERARGRYALTIAVAADGTPHVAPPASREYPRLRGVLA